MSQLVPLRPSPPPASLSWLARLATVLPLLALSFPALGASFRLEYKQDIAAVAASETPIALQVVNARPPNEGAENDRRIGTIRGGYGNGFAMTVRRDDPDLTTWFQMWLEDLAAASGHPVVTTGPALRLTITRLWTDGYMVNWMQLDGQLDLIDPLTGNSVWTHPISKGGSAFLGGGLFSKRVIGRMLNHVVEELSPEVEASLRDPTFAAALDKVLSQVVEEPVPAPVLLPVALTPAPSARSVEEARHAERVELARIERERRRGGHVAVGAGIGGGSLVGVGVQLGVAHWTPGIGIGTSAWREPLLTGESRWSFGSHANAYQPGIVVRATVSTSALAEVFGSGGSDPSGSFGVGYDSELFLGKKGALRLGIGVAVDSRCEWSGQLSPSGTVCFQELLGATTSLGFRQWF